MILRLDSNLQAKKLLPRILTGIEQNGWHYRELDGNIIFEKVFLYAGDINQRRDDSMNIALYLSDYGFGIERDDSFCGCWFVLF